MTTKKIKLLLEHKANKEAKDAKGNTPLQLAMKNNNIQLMELLINNGVNINVLDDENNTPLINAVKSGNV